MCDVALFCGVCCFFFSKERNSLFLPLFPHAGARSDSPKSHGSPGPACPALPSPPAEPLPSAGSSAEPADLAVSQVTPLRQLEPVKLDPFISAELTDNQPSGFLGNKILARNSESFPGHFQHGEWSREALD